MEIQDWNGSFHVLGDIHMVILLIFINYDHNL